MSTLALQQNVPEEQTLEELRSMLARERADRCRLQAELQLRNCALDTAGTYFMIVEVAHSPWKIVYVNRAICDRHGYSASELLGQSPASLVCVHESRAALGLIADAVAHGNSV